MQLSEIERREIERSIEFIMNNDVSDKFIVQKIELLAGFADIESIQVRAKRIGLSYNGIKKTRNIQTILGQKFVIGKEKRELKSNN